ncbi:hypothetical protein [Micromonospora sp. RTGN7]|uniref:hypothetical protein n=1 Tax=Micromonospora sp. RTGN7 TaxID=3016526 RepID=UPI0029FEC9D1|nr:hypothetical protein [Micromonospora sp. RTGN7]
MGAPAAVVAAAGVTATGLAVGVTPATDAPGLALVSSDTVRTVVVSFGPWSINAAAVTPPSTPAAASEATPTARFVIFTDSVWLIYATTHWPTDQKK